MNYLFTALREEEEEYSRSLFPLEEEEEEEEEYSCSLFPREEEGEDEVSFGVIMTNT